MYCIRPWLYIGKVRETGDRRIMDAYQIGAILQLAYPATHSGIESLYIAIDDGVPLPPLALEQGVHFAREQKAAGPQSRHWMRGGHQPFSDVHNGCAA